MVAHSQWYVPSPILRFSRVVSIVMIRVRLWRPSPPQRLRFARMAMRPSLTGVASALPIRRLRLPTASWRGIHPPRRIEPIALPRARRTRPMFTMLTYATLHQSPAS